MIGQVKHWEVEQIKLLCALDEEDMLVFPNFVTLATDLSACQRYSQDGSGASPRSTYLNLLLDDILETTSKVGYEFTLCWERRHNYIAEHE